MANTKSAKKMIRKIERRTTANKARRTNMRTHIRKVEEAIAAGDKTQAIATLRQAEPKIVRSAQKGILHKRTAARKISRLTKRVNSIA